MGQLDSPKLPELELLDELELLLELLELELLELELLEELEDDELEDDEVDEELEDETGGVLAPPQAAIIAAKTAKPTTLPDVFLMNMCARPL